MRDPQTPFELLGPDGPLARHVAGFAPRLAQREMAERIAGALDARDVLVAEAGTGTGKTFAYLVPALLSGRKIVISTGTKHLQDQLFHRDLPAVRAALGAPVKAALLKGRANYLCLHRLDRSAGEGRFVSRAQVEELRIITRWAGGTRSGDIAEAGEVSESSPLWPQVTSTADNCLGQECARFSECFVTKARRAAQEADIVVVNHHLLCADLALKGEGHGDLLPLADTFIIDEAHQLPEVAGAFFGITLGSRQLVELARDTVIEHAREAGDIRELPPAADRLETAARRARIALGVQARRFAWKEVADNDEWRESLARIGEALAELRALLEQASVRGKGLENCLRRCETLAERVEFMRAGSREGYVRWLETYTQSFAINMTPLETGAVFQQSVERLRAGWIFTSATLAVNGNFDHFLAELGVSGAQTACWESPFDYQTNALLYAPPGLPLPHTSHYTAAVIDAALPVLHASGGRAFLLFTSHRALTEAARLLKDKIPFPLLVQGEAPRGELLERFRRLGNAVLLGAASFWEGVDVRGEALSVVIIDKLPFAAPNDPVMQARLDALRERGGEPFTDYQLPQAVIALKQGVGRLIRDANDRGVMMLCDPRLLGKSYGRVFLNSLPPMRRTRALSDVEEFFPPLPLAGEGEHVKE